MARNKSSGSDETKLSLDDRRHRAGVTPLDFEPRDFDPALGTLSWARFSALLTSGAPEGDDGALLVIDGHRGSSNAKLSASDVQDILPLLADALRQAVRHGDVIAHLEGMRFAILLRGASQEVAGAVAERIHQSVDNTLFLTAEGLAPVCVDVGGTMFESGTSQSESLLALASSNLEMAASSGVHTRIS